MAFSCGSVAMCVTNSPVSRILTKLSLSVTPSDRGCIVSESRAGLRPTTVKNDIGARLATPVWDNVLTHAMGRGITLPISSLYADFWSRSDGSMIMVGFSFGETMVPWWLVYRLTSAVPHPLKSGEVLDEPVGRGRAGFLEGPDICV